ncbi:MAG: hypothetical protein CMM69_05480 [Rhodospirillaceae bacterium]|nr:hypothetical protein [Rhodospirillaceae bacterium]OUX29106.1 MAG: hypothetical protein CBE16_05755 [Rhodospirillaceae bacterium TMED256]
MVMLLLIICAIMLQKLLERVVNGLARTVSYRSSLVLSIGASKLAKHKIYVEFDMKNSQKYNYHIQI